MGVNLFHCIQNLGNQFDANGEGQGPQKWMADAHMTVHTPPLTLAPVAVCAFMWARTGTLVGAGVRSLFAHALLAWVVCVARSNMQE